MMNVILDISNKRWLDQQEAEVYTTLSHQTLYELRESGKIPYRKSGVKIIYDRKHLDAYMERLTLYHDGKIRPEIKTKIPV